MQTKMDAPAQQSHQQLRDAPKQMEQAPNESEQLFEDSRPVVSQLKATQAIMAASPRNQSMSAMQAMMANSPQQQAMRTMQAKMASSPRVQNQLIVQAKMAAGSLAQRKAAQNNTASPAQLAEEDEPLQPKLAEEPAQLQQTETAEPTPPEAPKRNNTGLPNQLKSGIESLSGMSMDHVKVHFNSNKPAELNAHAYAQGSDIHVASGQEQHVPHEAWHVVQQAQGRVKPTMQMKGDVPVNDEAGLEHEADVMGEKALALGSLKMRQQEDYEVSTPSRAVELVRQNQVVQLDRLYDTTLSPHKSKLTEWLVETNKTLGLSQAGDTGTPTAKKKSNFSWHHILAFADLSQHGEGKTAPANHGGNLRLGPMKNRFESADVSGGTAVDYGYLPLDGSENIILDAYSKGIFDGTIEASNKSSLTGMLSPSTNDKTPQAENFTVGNEANVFGEWFLESQMKNALLSKEAISGKLVGARQEEISVFINKIDTQFNSLLRTYKYYNKKKEVQTTSGVAMTDISEGNFGQIIITIGTSVNKASTIIDELLRDQKWVKRGSQGALLDETTTYKFGLAAHEPFTKLVEDASGAIDLTLYRTAKLAKFKEELEKAFSDFRDAGKESDDFDQARENALIAKLVVNLNAGATNYDELWGGTIGEVDVDTQYVKVKLEDKDWDFPTPVVSDRRDAITETDSSDTSKIADAWENIFVEKLVDWDGSTPLFDEEIDPSDLMYINFKEVGESIVSNERSWKIADINRDRSKRSSLPKDFLTVKMTLGNVKKAVAHDLSENRETYLSNEKVELKLDEVKAGLSNCIKAHFNVFSKRIKGVEKDVEKRRLAFGADFEGFVNSTKWNVINRTKMPTDIDGAKGKKWADLGDLQNILYVQWLEQQRVESLITEAVTSVALSRVLP